MLRGAEDECGGGKETKKVFKRASADVISSSSSPFDFQLENTRK